MQGLTELIIKIKKCNACAAFLPFLPHPVLRANSKARILIIGQAPGSKAHESSTPWNDRSGDRLRNWLGINREEFYSEENIAIIPMGFCYPGINKNGGDNPPRSECAPLWHQSLINLLPNIRLMLLVGSYAQRYYLKKNAKATLTSTVKAWDEYLPYFFPLPHPSWRNTAWLKKHPWFNTEVLPRLKTEVRNILT